MPPPLIVETEVPIRGLDPRHDGVRIAHLSDVHVGRLTGREHVRAAVEAANAAAPDLVALTGDYVSWSRTEIPLAEEQLAGLRAPRVLAVLGNHDYFTSGRHMAAALARNGYDVLRNQHTVIEVRGAPLTVVGVDDPITRHDDPDAAFDGAREAGARLVLVHYPVRAQRLVARGADLILSGHTHGGQIRLPLVTDRLMRRAGLRYQRGLYELSERSRLYVTAGVGYSGVRVRVGRGAAAEVAVLRLRAV